MATLTIKNIPKELYEELKRRAAENRRSMNGEVIHRLEQTVRSPQRDARAILENIRAFRATLPTINLTERQLRKAKSTGRP